MTTTITSRLQAVRQYLAEKILPGVPREKRSDFRAALKILEHMESEIDILPDLLVAEIEEMFRLCDTAFAALGRTVLAEEDYNIYNELTRCSAATNHLSERQNLHAELSSLVGRLAVLLRQKVETEPKGQNCPSGSKVVLTKCHQLLRRQASARIGWQAVFPATTFYRETLKTDEGEAG